MKNLRGRPSNISGSGIVYLDSDSDDESEYSDSDVEPVFFPPPFLPPGQNFFVLADLVQDDSDIEVISDSETDHVILNDLSEEDDEVSLVEDSDIEPIEEEVSIENLQPELGNINNPQQEDQQQQNSDNSQLSTVTVNNNLVVSEAGESPQAVPNLNSEAAEPPTIGNAMADQVDNHEAVPDEKESLRRDGNQATNSSVSLEEAEVARSSASSLVPYPDLPDYASGEEDDDDVYTEKAIKTVTVELDNEKLVRNTSRQSLKRKEPDNDDYNENEEEDFDRGCVRGEGESRTESTPKSKKNDRGENSEDEEEFCNPMASDEEECEKEEEAFRGDRIGSTVYSERHVIKILMKWIQELPNHSLERILQARENGESEEFIEKKIQRMELEFEEQMSLLWDMSAEPDVMHFLVENKIFTFIRDTVDRSACNRLTEVSLGILANVISEPSIIEDFTIHDSSIQLVEKVVELSSKVSDVSVLVQVFSVLRRVVWYLKNMSPVKKWMDLLLSPGFLGCANFIMKSSRNALLLGTVIMFFFTLLDCLNPDSENEEDGSGDEEDTSASQESSSSSEKKKMAKQEQLAKSYEPFLKSDFVPALCEGLKELMKDPKPASTRRKLTSTRERPAGPSSLSCQTDDHCPNADEIDVPIPEGHVQQAILKGLSTLTLLRKATNGQEALGSHAQPVLDILLNFLRAFSVCTEAVSRSNSLQYFTLTLHLLSYVHTSLESVNTNAIICPVTTASKLINEEERDKEADTAIRVELKDGVEFDSVSYIAVVTHEYLATVAEKFGPECALEVRNNVSHAKFFAVLDEVVSKFNNQEDSDKRSNNKDSSDATASARVSEEVT